jgi:acyl CoA:acetate/3-ketoacid CoA transferase beta subunit
MVEKLDFVTSVGHGDGGDFRARLGLPGLGPQAIITDLGVLRCEAGSCEFVLSSVHPGVEISRVLEATGWSLRVADDVGVTAAPTDGELRALRSFVGA